MKTLNFNRLLLKTAFSCMACDGHIDKREVELIRQLHNENETFEEIDISSELDSLMKSFNNDGNIFLKDYFNELISVELSEEQELELIEVAINTIEADDKIEYSEIKFFKVIRSKLKVKNDTILEEHPEFESYLEQDIISDTYLSRLQNVFFENIILNRIDIFNEIDDSLLG